MSTCIEHIAHTGFRVSHDGFSLLIDPVLVTREASYRQPVVPNWTAGNLDSVSAVFISHGHDDHLHPPSLLGLPRATPVYYLDEEPESCSCGAPSGEMLARLGFENRHPFLFGQQHSPHPGITVHIIAARKSVEGEEQCCFVVETPDVVFLDAVDIRDDPVTRDALGPFRGDLDLAFVPAGLSTQYDGTWNQMDIEEAVNFCRWLDPKLAAPCGGILSLGQSPSSDSLERYPVVFENWLARAMKSLGPDRVLSQSPPLRLVYRDHGLPNVVSDSSQPILTAENGEPAIPAALTTFFAGYHPRKPTRLNLWPDHSLRDWLTPLQDLRHILPHAGQALKRLVSRCASESNRTPCGVLATYTLRALVQAGQFDTAAGISALVPWPTDDAGELELSFYTPAELVIGAAVPDTLKKQLDACLRVDRRLFQICCRSRELRVMKSRGPVDADEAARHFEAIRISAGDRRPTLGPHHLWLQQTEARYLGIESDGIVAYLFGPTTDGLRRLELGKSDAMLLNLCDGRRFDAIATELATRLDLAENEASEALWLFLQQLHEAMPGSIEWN